MDAPRIDDEEIVYRRIPPSGVWFEPPDRLTSANFKLGRDEAGLSVYRAAIASVDDVLRQPTAIAGSGVAQATVGAIRALCDARSQPLNLDVIAVDDANDPGHAEVRGEEPGRLSKAASRALQRAFAFVRIPKSE